MDLLAENYLRLKISNAPMEETGQVGGERRIAVVTGGGRGIGRAISRRLSADGWHVAVLGRHDADLKAAVAEGDAVHACAADVTNPASLASAISSVQEMGPIGLMVANAGAVETAPFGRSDAALFERMLSVNFMGVVNAFQAVLPSMLGQNSGRLIAIASTAGLRGYGYVSAYAAAKHAVVGLVRSLALEVAQKGITVNAICPGYTDTDIVARGVEAISQKTGRGIDEARATFQRDNPQGRLISPDEVAAVASFLAGDLARSVSGQAIAVNGGEF
jgi:NAD(P)-dependent dehydrogenase (short-subunit alcohol dehydrogenase family)